MSSLAQDPIPQLGLGNTFGALFIGVILAAVRIQSAGITFFKLVVRPCCLIVGPGLDVTVFDALHLALTIHCVYYYLVTNYANFGVLAEIVWSLKIFIIPTIHFKGRSRALPVIALTIVVVLSAGESVACKLSRYKVKLFKDLVGIEWSTYMSLGATTFVDFVIASSLCYLLATSRTGFSRTDSFITKLVGYTISTGCLTSICSMSIIITCAVMPTTFIFIGLQFLVTKLYVNSFIAFLNARYYIQANAIVDSHQLYERHGVYHPELHISASQDEEFQKSQKDPEGEMLHITQPIQAAMSPIVEMKSFLLLVGMDY
ncbi:hypothetical protein DFJ58DRAFT_811000 [Suillus subalutaceus]|uniref:uncharacterized protein n=1 Tax=Suillus subalutaceus TaxID=48586 RepID=UPI001B8686E8|nr:uncharacterized protein DFJ58DRAFT_811000 [Suillus subalutaceus]KAG1840179.1 hypothetical protein DFJ58DRAFT_811000 [Suillus subalutaceus]